MPDLTGRIDDIKFDALSGRVKLTLEVNERRAAYHMYDNLKDCDKLAIQLKKYRKRRSLNANALCWKLCGEIADVLRTDKDSVYLDMLKQYGQSELVSVMSHINVSGYFKYYDVFGSGTIKGKEFTHYRVYKGSSEYDTREMSILIDGILSHAKELDIDVLSDQEISQIKSEWQQ